MKLPINFKNNMKSLLGEKEYKEYLNSFNMPANTALRKNTLKSWVDFSYENYNLKKISWTENGYYFENSNAGKSIFHDAGLYYIQDASAMAVVELLSPKPNERILDVCSAPGSKATQIADKMKNTGLLVANEIIPSRAKILSYNIERMGITNCVVLNEDTNTLANHFQNFFDKVLVDAPCSGEGMFRKNPDAINEWEKTNIFSCAERQLEILENASQCVKPGGILAYSTCTFNQEENEKVIYNFLSKHNEFSLFRPENTYKDFSNGIYPKDITKNTIQLEKCVRLFPHKINGEGHFMAFMMKENFEKENVKPLKNTKKQNLLKTHSIVNKWLKSNSINLDIDNIVLFGDNIYHLNDFTLNIEKLKVLRYGLLLGSVEKDRFIPSHSLALSLNPININHINLSKEELEKYLHGETFSCEKDDGWVLVCYNNLPIGWGKIVNNIIKNYYPKGLRK